MPRGALRALTAWCILSSATGYRDEEKARSKRLARVAVDAHAEVSVLEKARTSTFTIERAQQSIAEELQVHTKELNAPKVDGEAGNDGAKDGGDGAEIKDPNAQPANPKPEDFLCKKDQKVSRYDEFVKDMLPLNEEEEALVLDDKTAVFIIGMQNDFVTGSFRMPCEDRQKELVKNVAGLVSRASAAGATIMTSLDFHTEKHCSFKDTTSCNNEFFLTDKDAQEKRRYKNEFVPHTTFEEQDGKVVMTVTKKNADKGVPEDIRGAAIESSVREALKKASEAHQDKVFEMFAGFSDNVESFSAFPLFNGSDTAEQFTGAFIPASLDDALKGTATDCFKTDDQKEPCLPSLAQMKDTKLMTGVDQLFEALKKKEPFKKILITGLVFDYCVKETSIAMKQYFAKNVLSGTEVYVVADYTRPAAENTNMEAVATQLGSTAIDMHEAGVKFARVAAEDKIVATKLKFKPGEVQGSANSIALSMVTAAAVLLSLFRAA